VIEIVTVALLAVATVGSAWSAYQVSRWGGVETDEARTSAAFRIDSSREHALATQIVAYDAASVSQLAAAIADDDLELQEFLRDAIVRPPFRPVLAEWREQLDAGGTPTNLIENEEYLSELFAASDEADAAALEATGRSEEAAGNADDYVRLTLFFATALFFAGITATFGTRTARLLLLAAAGLVLGTAGILLAAYPVA
jgi:hypothetical protein